MIRVSVNKFSSITQTWCFTSVMKLFFSTDGAVHVIIVSSADYKNISQQSTLNSK